MCNHNSVLVFFTILHSTIIHLCHNLIESLFGCPNLLIKLVVPHRVMKPNRQTSQNHFPISEAFIRELFDKMKNAAFPDGDTPDSEFTKFLYAVQHIERYPAKDVKSGRRPRFEREKLFVSASLFKRILEIESSERFSLLYYISNCLPVLKFPPDLRTALNEQKINLDEARTLARISRKNLGDVGKQKPVEIRRQIMISHIKRGDSQNALKRRVKERLGIAPNAEALGVSTAVAQMDLEIDALILLNESDTTHLFWEDIKNLVFIAREVDTTLIDTDSLKNVVSEIQGITFRLMKYQRKKEKWWENR